MGLFQIQYVYLHSRAEADNYIRTIDPKTWGKWLEEKCRRRRDQSNVERLLLKNNWPISVDATSLQSQHQLKSSH